MPLARTGDLVAAAAAQGVGIAAVNMITLEHGEAIVAAAERAETAIIVQISQNAVAFHGGNVHPVAAAAAALATAAGVPVSLHLDHVDDDTLLVAAADAGFSSVMFDAGAKAYAENVQRTRDAARWAHDAGLWIEAELGFVGGKPDAPRSAHSAGTRTDPAEAAAYVAETGVDALAVAVGSSHAMTSRDAAIDDALVARIAAAVPVPLVLHGSSGVPDDHLRRAVGAGMVKVNVGTALNVAMTSALRAELAADERVVDPRRYLAPARDAMTATVEHLLAVVRSPARKGL